MLSRHRLISTDRDRCARSRPLEASAAAPSIVRSSSKSPTKSFADYTCERPHVDLQAIAQQIDTIYDRIDTLAATSGRADDAQPALQQLEKLRRPNRRVALSQRRVRPPSMPRSARIWLRSNPNRRC